MITLKLRRAFKEKRKECAKGHDMHCRTDVASCPLVIPPCVAFGAFVEMKGERKCLKRTPNPCNSVYLTDSKYFCDIQFVRSSDDC